MSRILAPVAEPVSNSDAVRVESLLLSSTNLDRGESSVTFTLGPTSLVFIVGPAGSGKSAILDLLSFRGQATKGRIEVLGVDPARLAPSHRPRMRRRLGLMFQDQRLLPDLDVFANVALAAQVARRRTSDYTRDVNELLLWVGLKGRGDEPIANLTEGETRRVCLARALVNRPELLIADDPTSGLGDKAERAIMRLICDVNRAGTPVVFATRNRSLAQSVGGSLYDMPARANS